MVRGVDFKFSKGIADKGYSTPPLLNLPSRPRLTFIPASHLKKKAYLLPHLYSPFRPYHPTYKCLLCGIVIIFGIK